MNKQEFDLLLAAVDADIKVTKQAYYSAVDADIKVTKQAYYSARAKQNELSRHPLNHVYDDLKKAEWETEDFLRELAGQDCEGSYNCGAEEYVQQYIVNGVLFECTAKFEYNRHDKTYYFVDGSSYEHKGIGPYEEEA